MNDEMRPWLTRGDSTPGIGFTLRPA